MLKFIVLPFSLMLCCISSMAEKYMYPVSEIPDSLLKDANVVKRYDDLTVTILSPKKANIKRSFVYTILNEGGDGYASFSDYYTQYRDISSIEGKLFDATGKEIGRVHKKDIDDLSLNEGNKISDMRYKAHHFYCKNYPYTVAYEWEVDTESIFALPDWTPQSTPWISVQQSNFNVIVPAGFKLHYKEYNLSYKTKGTQNDKTIVYNWFVHNMPAVKSERYAPDLEFFLPHVRIAPSEFVWDNYKGGINSWQDFGRFIFQLNIGRDILPEDVKNKVHKLTDHLSSDNEKIRVLYNYLQLNTRYVYVGFGIGNWQPQTAEYVAKNGYGDCKALSNFMFALLKEAGISSKYTIIKSGNRSQKDVDENFACYQFDHIILCVPQKNDTTWLECTSQTLPAGYLSGFTCNRPAILVDETGGTLVHTPAYGVTDNLQQRNISAKLDEMGNLSVVAKTQYRALQQDDKHDIINGLSKEKIMERLKNYLDLPTYDVTNFNYQQDKTAIPSVFETLDLTIENYAQVSGKRLFIQPNIMTKNIGKLKTDEERKYDIQFEFEYNDADSVDISIPPGYMPEAVPADTKLESEFGKYISSVKVMPEKIIYYRDMKKNSGLFPAKDYDKLVKFYEAIYKADRAKVVLVKKT